MTTLKSLEEEITQTKEYIEKLETDYHQRKTSFKSRYYKIQEKMDNEHRNKKDLIENELSKLIKQLVNQETKLFVVGQILVKKRYNGERVFVLVTEMFNRGEGRFYRGGKGFIYTRIGVSGVGVKQDKHWYGEEDTDVEIVCDSREYLNLCVKYGIKKPILNKSNLELIYEGIFKKKLNDRFSYSDLHKLGIITK
jgi:hypothetical protein